ncbi:hypothetical protein EDC02_7415 [Micromonospora sp. Llam0]|uniref:hypothetical protein n=1 Tax=Micromonospora sp. Llam0 TaxID=2485143 RepID=UPI000FC0472D|nr:hypothetical protein [Micromonospora sp. Llam0]ROO52486.1 hypothetical protein EDC02_7415 [Micromonospora sp. Llam0]
MNGEDARPGGLVLCPVWCAGCGPRDRMHRAGLVTAGTERTGWVSADVIADHGAVSDVRVKVDVTRYASTQTVLLQPGPAARFLGGLNQATRLLHAFTRPTERVEGLAYRRAAQLEPGMRVLLFGGVVLVVDTDEVPEFPTAALLSVRQESGGPVYTVLVPADMEPLVIGP